MSDPVPSTQKPVLSSLQAGYVLESPGDRLDDAVTKAERSGALPRWERQAQAAGFGTWRRSFGEIAVTVTVATDGRAVLDVDAPTGGREIKPHEFDPDTLRRATVGLPRWVATRVDAALEAFARSQPVQTPQVNTEQPLTPRGSWWERLTHIKTDAQALAQAKEYTEERAEFVRTSLTECRKALSLVESTLPNDPRFAAYLETSEQLRHTLAQAVTAAENNPTLLHVVRTGYAKQAELLGKSVAALIEKGDIQQRGGLATRLEEGLRTFNNNLVRELSSVVDADLLKNLTKVAVAATGGSTKDTLDFAKGAASAGREGIAGPAVTVLQIRLEGAPRAVSSADLATMLRNHEPTSFVRSFLDYLGVFLKSDSPVWINVFPDGTAGPVQLALHKGGFTWIDNERDRPVTNQDLRTVGRDAMDAAMEEVAERIAKGLRSYFGEAVSDATPRAELLVKFDFEARSDKRSLDDLKVCMNAAGFPL
jgi:hypothetical protein